MQYLCGKSGIVYVNSVHLAVVQSDCGEGTKTIGWLVDRFLVHLLRETGKLAFRFYFVYPDFSGNLFYFYCKLFGYNSIYKWNKRNGYTASILVCILHELEFKLLQRLWREESINNSRNK